MKSDLARSRSSSSENKRRSSSPPRVLVLTHSHPRLTHGGAEISADALVQGLRKYYGLNVWLMGCSGKKQTDRLAINLTQPFGEDDFVYQGQNSFDYFKFANRDAKFPAMFKELLLELRPDVVHFHHYAQFGVEAFAIVRRTLPKAQIVLTLHEYLAICHNHGQMVKTKSHQLCYTESYIDCSTCFPELGPRDFFLRKAYIQSFFQFIDIFISPSEFLAARYIRWGVPNSKIKVLENIFPETVSTPKASSLISLKFNSPDGISETPPPYDRHVRIGFFGQMSPMKGISVLLAAAKELALQDVSNLSIEIYGDYSNQPIEFQKSVVSEIELASCNVKYRGPYDNAQVLRLMASVDAVLVPSIWWENSPVVIQEAFAARKPVLCSNIGGMAEKVRPDIDGFWFEAGDSGSLAQLLLQIARKPDVLTDLTRSLRPVPSIKSLLKAHLDAYRS